MAIFLGCSPQAPPGPDPLTATPPPSWLLKEKEPLFFLSRSCARILFWGSSPSSKPTLPSMHFEGRRKRRAGKGLPLFQPGSKEAKSTKTFTASQTPPLYSFITFFHTMFPFHFFAHHLVQTTGQWSSNSGFPLPPLPCFPPARAPSPLHTPPHPLERGGTQTSTWGSLAQFRQRKG